ncbi:hypothetical protein [Thermococcus prieurii]
MKPGEFFALLVGAYVGTAWLGKVLYSSTLGRLEIAPATYAVLFLVILYLSYRIDAGIPAWAFGLGAMLLLIPLGIQYVLGGLVALGILRHLMSRDKLIRGTVPATVVSIGLVVAASLHWGIPLLKPSLRYTSASVPFLVAGDIMIGVIAARPSLGFLLVGEVIAIVGASRTVGLGVAVAYLLRLAYDGKLTVEETRRRKYVILTVVLLTLAVFAARYHVTIKEYPGWRLGFFGTLIYRPASSYTVYERLFHMGMPLGNHELLFTPDPTGYVGRLFGKKVGYTYTLFGQPVYDFGVLGLIEAIILGTALRTASKNGFTGTFAFTVAILMMDIGIEGTFLAAILYLACLAQCTEGGIWSASKRQSP